MTLLSKPTSSGNQKPHGAIQLFNFDENDQITFNSEEVLRLLQHPDIKNKKVCVISIAGALRQGKSFILNFFIRYLSFIIAVIIMDTQGTFDNQTTQTQCASIFALSVLLSSVQIYNLKENIRQDDLLHLQLFSGYGRMMSQSTNAKPFQKLLFLIRDWQWSDGKTGDDLLQTALNNLQESKKEELISLKDSITENFEKISCFLLPHPGKAVATSLDFSGNVDEIEPEFREQIEKLVPDILGPDKIVPKIVNNQPITVEQLIELIRAYWKRFKDGKIPTVRSAFMATVEAHSQIAFRGATEKYYQLMVNCKSKTDADKIKEDVLKQFRSQIKLGNADISQKYENKLNKQLDKIFANNYKETIEDAEFRSTIKTGVVGGTVVSTGIGVGALAVAEGMTIAEFAIGSAIVGVGTLGAGLVIGGGLYGAYKWGKWISRKPNDEKTEDENAILEAEGYSNTEQETFNDQRGDNEEAVDNRVENDDKSGETVKRSLSPNVNQEERENTHARESRQATDKKEVAKDAKSGQMHRGDRPHNIKREESSRMAYDNYFSILVRFFIVVILAMVVRLLWSFDNMVNKK